MRPTVSALAHDLRYALRRLRRSPGFTLTAILTLGLGLGATTLLFAAVHAVLLRPLPYNDPHELLLLWEQDPANGSQHVEVSLPHFEAWRTQASSFSSLAALGSTDWGDLEVRAEDPFALTQRVVSGSFFETLGASAALGRTLRPSDEVPGAPSVMVLSHASWRREFGSSPAVIGRTLSVVGRDDPLEIVGVMPPSFRFPAATDAWLPVAPALAQVFRQNNMDERQRRGLGVLYVIGRLAPEVTPEAARAEMDVLVPGVWDSFFAGSSSRRVVATSLERYLFGTAGDALWSLFGAVICLLAIAVANVAGLQMVRTEASRRDTAVRMALGVSPGRLWRQHFVEAALVALGGAACGVAGARAALPLVVALAPTDIPRVESIGLAPVVLAFAAMVTIVCTLAATRLSTAPIRRLASSGWLHAGTARATGERSLSRARNLLICGEVALATVLTVVAGLLTVSYLNLSRTDLGFRPANVASFALSPRADAYASVDARRRLYRRMLDRVRRVPGVQAAAGVHLMPFQLDLVGSDGAVTLESDPPDDDTIRQRPGVGLQSVTPGYFRAMGIRLVDGRVFTEQDDADTPGAILVGESTARQLWPGETAIGKRVVVTGAAIETAEGPAWQTVIGVVADTRHREISRDRLDVYVPFSQVAMELRHVVVRTERDPLLLAAALREAVTTVDPVQRVGSLRTLDSLVSSARRPWQFNMTLALWLGGVGTVLAALALFGTVAHGVSQRTREIGVRRALGASAGHVVSLVAKGAMGAACAGAGIGVIGGWVAGQLLRPLLFEVAPSTTALGGLTATVLLVCALATVLAAWRAVRIEPSLALRSE